jgi:signal transduction histidine kinase
MQGAQPVAAIGRWSGDVTYHHPPTGSLYQAMIVAGKSLAGMLGAWALGVQSKREAELCRSVAVAAAAGERRRIARDLHDGLAQDLAFIAAHGDRLARELGTEHPLAIAARRALAVSRGAIAELSAPDAPTAGDALREVADELGGRFDMQVDVHAKPLALTPSAREDVVRIAREAIVNAARHGRAEKVVVSLTPENDGLVLKVRDDGVGIGAAAASEHGGFGFMSMRERATALGGSLSARTATSGGTELELVVPS